MDTKQRFHHSMLDIYRESKKIGYVPTYFLRMVEEDGGYEAARKLIHSSTISDGFSKLWEKKRLDLSVEALVLREYSELFTKQELEICEKRLAAYSYFPVPQSKK